METPTIGSFVIGILLWVGYFTAVVLICHTLYMKLRGEPPKSHLTVIVDGKSVSALAEWEARDKRLQKAMIGLGIFLGLLLPLFLPWVLRR
ncbi:MAG: hypothetical protein HY208_00940 [Nitrospirae bacterium]|nr:hypothetical protein [Nitrospirota bacterium]